MRRPSIVSFLFAFAVITSALPARNALAEDPYQIDVILPMTGGGAFLGKEDAQTLSIIQGLANKSGGIKGRPITFKIYDDQTNPTIDLQVANQIIADKAAVFLGPQLVGGCNAVAPLLKDGPVMYCYSPGIYADAGSFIFSGNLATRDMIAVSIKYFRERGWKKIGILSPTDATGQDGDRAIDAAMALPENHELTIVARERFNLTDLSVSAQMARIKAAGAQAMIAWVTGTAFATTLRAAADSGVTIPLVTSTGNLLYAQLESQSGVIDDNVLFPATPGDAIDALPNGQLRSTVAAYQDAIRAAGLRPDQGQTLAWDPTWIVIDALRKLGPSATAVQIRDYIANLHGFVGINGVYDFRAIPQRGLNASSVIMVRWVKDKDAWVIESQPGGALVK